MLSHEERVESGQFALGRRGGESAGTRCCPTVFQQCGEVAPQPQRGAHIGEQAREAVRPVVAPSEKAKEEMHEQRGPDLPLHGVGAVAEEVDELHRLLELLEEHFDLPAAAVQVAHGDGTPVQMVGEENHDPFLAVDFDHRRHAAQELRIIFLGVHALEHDQIVAPDAGIGVLGQAFFDFQLEVVFRAGDPENSPGGELPEMHKMHVRFVEERDFPGAQARAEFGRAHVVVLARSVHNGEARQEAQQVEPQMALGGGFAPTVLRPRHTIGHELNRGGIDDVDRAAETPGQRIFSAATETGMLGLEMVEHFPEKSFGKHTVAFLVRMTERIAGRRGGLAHREEGRHLEAQRIAHVVEPEGMADLRVNHRDHVTPRREGPRLGIDPGLTRQFRREIGRNEFDDLPQDRKVGAARLFGFFLFHPCLVAG